MAKVLKGDFSIRPKAERVKPRSDRLVPSYRLHLALPFSDPLIWRCIQVPGSMTLAGLHRTIQVCMNWRDSETHQFLVGKIFYSPGFGIERSELTVRKREFDEAKFQLHQLEEAMSFIFTYLYDGGEGWEMEITLEETVEQGAQYDYPVLLDGECGCPPEDIGDIHQYQTLLEQGTAESLEIKLAIPGEDDFYPRLCDVEAINSRLKNII